MTTLEPIPLTVIEGYLGGGKTTLITQPTGERIVAACLLDDSALDSRLAVTLESGHVWVV